MKLRNAMVPLLAAAGLVTTAAFVTSATAQSGASAPAAKIAIVNPAKVFNDMQETKDLKVKLDNERNVLQQTDTDKRRRLQDLNDQRQILKADSPQYADKSREFTQAAIEFQAWTQITQQELQRNQKIQMKSLFEKIQTATAQIAIQKGYDLVFADQRPEFPDNLEQVNVDQLRALINQRNVLYAVAAVDLTPDVTAQLDTQYKSSPVGGGAPTSAAPATGTPAAK